MKNALGYATCIAILLFASGCGLATSDEERLQRADEQMASGAYRAAIIELKNVLANNSDNVRARLMLAEISLGLGDLLTAEKELSRAAELDAPESDLRPLHLRILAAKNQHTEVLAMLGMDAGGLTDAEQFSFRGQALLGLRNAAAAEATYREWLAAEPGSVDAAVGLAKADAISGNTERAIESLRAIVSSNPQHVDALHTLGALYVRVGNYADSERALREAIVNSAPQMNIQRYVAINAALVETQLALGKIEDARSSLARLTAVVPQSPIALFLAARLARMDQDYALAARHLQMLLNVSPNNRPAQLFLANVQMMQGNDAQAEMLLNSIVQDSPDNIQARKLLAQVQLRRSQPEGAIEALAPLLEQSEDDADIYNLLAQISMQQGDAQSVIDNLRAAAESAPEDREIRLNLTVAYLNVGEVDLAAEVLGSVPETADGNFRRQKLQLSVFSAQGSDADAEQYATALLDQHGDNSDVVLIVANYYVSEGDDSRGRQILSQFIRQNPDDVATSLSLARLDLVGGNTDSAKALFLAARKVEPDNLFAMLGLARIAEVNEEHDEALALLEEARAAHAEALAPRAWLALRYVTAGRTQEAEGAANELTAIGFRSAEISQIVGRVFVEVARLDDAIAQFEFAAELQPESPEIQLYLARTRLAADRTIEARESLSRALELRPGWIPAKMLLTLVELRQGNADAALQHVAELRSANPDSISVMVLEGEVLLYQNDYANAAAAFNLAVSSGAGRRAVLREFQARSNGQMPEPQQALVSWLEANPDDIVVRMSLAQYYLSTRSGDDAIREFETVLELQPDNTLVLNNLAWQYQQHGDLENALEKATRAFELADQSGSIADTLGWIYRDLGQLDKSLELLGDATRLSPDNGEIRFHLATVLMETGKEEEAREILQELVTGNIEFPSRSEAESLLERL